jgi:hypothetical protein
MIVNPRATIRRVPACNNSSAAKRQRERNTRGRYRGRGPRTEAAIMLIGPR